MQTVSTEQYWTDCTKLCLETTECVLVVESESNCSLFDKSNILSVTLLSKDSGKRVGFKRTMDFCPNSGEPPLFGNTSEPMYTLNLNGDMIQFGKRCMEGSILSVRGDKSVCITPRLFDSPYKGNYALAEKLCSTDNGLGLAGVYSEDEEYNIRAQWNTTWNGVTSIQNDKGKILTNDVWVNGVCGGTKDSPCVASDSMVDTSLSQSRYRAVDPLYGIDTVFCAFLSPFASLVLRSGCNGTSAYESSAIMRGAVCLTEPL
ncbi:unnamed protein product [Caenorhabditis brenneri]